jgi:serine O-acetyltransferase
MTDIADAALPSGERDENPLGIGLLALLAEDFATYDRDPLAPGFWAVAVHRVGNWRMGVQPKFLRAPLTVAYRVAVRGVMALWGIDLPYIVKIGRRLRIEGHGCVIIGARQIGDDVIIRHSVTIGVRERGGRAFPVIGNRVEIGPGACIVGGVSIGDDCFIGPNTVIACNMRPGTALLGIPLKVIDLAQLERNVSAARAGLPAGSVG